VKSIKSSSILKKTLSFFRLVIDSISPLEPERKCFRMVGGVLVERTIKEVLPALETNFNGVSKQRIEGFVKR
jgi:prefoldin subunit 2